MKMIPVISDVISAIGYDSTDNIMNVKLTTEEEYSYYNVPKMVFNEFTNAVSKGTYYNTFIKKHYSQVKISPIKQPEPLAWGSRP